jgi:ABC-type multidrug transport system ATPase subunit
MLSNGHVLAEGTPTELLALIDELGEIKIETATTAQAKKLAAVLNADPQVTRVEQHAEQVSALAKSAGKVLHKAVSEVHTLEILKAEVKKPELESVFFHLSGQIEQA